MIHIISPNYPEVYSNNADCIWLITAFTLSINHSIVLNLIDIYVERHYDFLNVGAGTDVTDADSRVVELTGSVVASRVIHHGTRVWARFTSDLTVAERGFSLEIVSVDSLGNNN